MKTLTLIALVASAHVTFAAVSFAAVPPAVKTALAEATLHLNAGQFVAAARVLRDLKQRLWLIGTPETDALRTRVEFVLWDLRMGLHDQAKRDLAALVAATAPAPAAPPRPAARP